MPSAFARPAGVNAWQEALSAPVPSAVRTRSLSSPPYPPARVLAAPPGTWRRQAIATILSPAALTPVVGRLWWWGVPSDPLPGTGAPLAWRWLPRDGFDPASRHDADYRTSPQTPARGRDVRAGASVFTAGFGNLPPSRPPPCPGKSPYIFRCFYCGNRRKRVGRWGLRCVTATSKAGFHKFKYLSANRFQSSFAGFLRKSLPQTPFSKGDSSDTKHFKALILVAVLSTATTILFHRKFKFSIYYNRSYDYYSYIRVVETRQRAAIQSAQNVYLRKFIIFNSFHTAVNAEPLKQGMWIECQFDSYLPGEESPRGSIFYIEHHINS